MLKKTINYTDFNGEQVSEDFYFNLTKAELTEMEFSKDGGVSEFIKKITNERNHEKLVEFFKEFILKCYGEKSIDGKHFMKSKEITHAFECSAAYSELFMELSTNAKSSADFVNSVIPKDLQKEVAAEMEKLKTADNPTTV